MHKPDAPCKATGVALSRMVVEMGQNGLTMTVTSHLLDDQGITHGSQTYVGPWANDTVGRLDELVLAVEEELAKIHFEVESDGPAVADADYDERPKGLLAARLESSEDQTPQI